MIRSAVTISLVPEARGGPFVFWDDLALGCERAAKLGFDAVEIFAPAAETLGAATLATVLSENRLALAALGTGAGWVKQRLRLTDPDSAVRKRATDFIAQMIDVGASFRAPAIIGSMQGRWGEGVSREKAMGWLAEGVEQLAARAAAKKITLLLEPLNRYETNLLTTVEETLAFLGRLKARNVKLLCDLFHMNIEERDMAAALRLAGSKVGHVHFADSNRCAIGFGHTDVTPVAAALHEISFDGFVSAEILPLPGSAAAAQQTIASFKRHFGGRAARAPKKGKA